MATNAPEQPAPITGTDAHEKGRIPFIARGGGSGTCPIANRPLRDARIRCRRRAPSYLVARRVLWSGRPTPFTRLVLKRLVLTLAAATPALAHQSPAPPGGLIITNARIDTADENRPVVEAMAVRGGRAVFPKPLP
jgi:hypothetical protein